MRRWLRELSTLPPHEATQLFHAGIAALNTASLDPAKHLKLLEMARPTAALLIRDLHKRLGNRNLPLPAAGREALQHLQELLRELADGYNHCLQGTSGKALPARRVPLTVHRALEYLDEVLLESARVYSPDPPGVWQALHRLYTQAEHRGFERAAIAQDEQGIPTSSVEEVYKRSCLLAICNPQSLRPGEAERLATFFSAHASSCDLSQFPVADAAGGVFLTDLSSDEPPFYVLLSELRPGPEMRALNLVQLVRRLREATRGPAVTGKSATVTPELAHQVLVQWSNTSAKRRFSRSQREQTLQVAIGFSAMHAALSGEPPPAPPQRKPKAIAQASDPRMDAANAWDTIARGNVITDLPTSKPERDETQRSAPASGDWPSWRVHDASVGGYSLIWDGDQASRAQVGEFVAVAPPSTTMPANWQIGVVRWIKAVEGTELQMGVQLISQRSMAAHIRKPDHSRRIPTIILPVPHQGREQHALLLPTGSAQQGETLELELTDKRLDIVLEKTLNKTQGLTRFAFREVSQ